MAKVSFSQVFFGDEAGAQAMRVDLRVRGEHAHEQRFLRHFEREDADHLVVEDGGVFGDVHGERGFAHRGARGDDDEVGGLEAGGHLVELGVMGGEAGDLLAAGVERVERAEGVA